MDLVWITWNIDILNWSFRNKLYSQLQAKRQNEEIGCSRDHQAEYTRARELAGTF